MDLLLRGCTLALGFSLLKPLIFFLNPSQGRTLPTRVSCTHVMVGENKTCHPDVSSSLAVLPTQAPLCLVLIQAPAVAEEIPSPEEAIPAFQSAFSKCLLRKSTHPLFESIECSVYLSSWTLQDNVPVSPGPRKRELPMKA